MTIFVANTGLLVLDRLESHVEGEYINDATVTVTITDPGGTPMTGTGWPDWPLEMEYVADTDGQYRATLPHTIPFVARRPYVARIDANAGGERRGQWRFPFTPQVRRDK